MQSKILEVCNFCVTKIRKSLQKLFSDSFLSELKETLAPSLIACKQVLVKVDTFLSLRIIRNSESNQFESFLNF